MSALKTALRFGLHGLGGVSVLRAIRAGGVRILCYHRFPNAEAWEQQCRHIREYYHPIPLSDVDSFVQRAVPLPPKAVAVTVDDGYRDFYATAFPVAQKYSIPMTLFAVTDFLDGQCWLWGDTVKYVLAHTSKANALPLVSDSLDSPAARRRAARKIIESLKKELDSRRREILACLPEMFDVTLPVQPPEDDAPLSWEDVRKMARRGVEFGAHTKTHPILPRVQSRKDLASEIQWPKKRLEEELQRPANYFCYPNGDFDQRAVECVQQSGYSSAYTTQWGRNLSPRPLLLERTPADPEWPFEFFKEVLAFGYPWRRPQADPITGAPPAVPLATGEMMERN